MPAEVTPESLVAICADGLLEAATLLLVLLLVL